MIDQVSREKGVEREILIKALEEAVKAAARKKGVFHRLFSSFSARLKICFTSPALSLREGRNESFPFAIIFGALSKSAKKSRLRNLYAVNIPNSKTRPWRRTLERNDWLNWLPRESGRLALRSIATIRSVSMTLAISISIGHRVVQASHEAQNQTEGDSRSVESWPK